MKLYRNKQNQSLYQCENITFIWGEGSNYKGDYYSGVYRDLS